MPTYTCKTAASVSSYLCGALADLTMYTMVESDSELGPNCRFRLNLVRWFLGLVCNVKEVFEGYRSASIQLRCDFRGICVLAHDFKSGSHVTV